MTMPDDQLHSMTQQLLVDGFEHAGPSAVALSDPLADTPMVVTLEQLRPYELNPRVTRNPLYDDIKTSIRERGLDAPPAITRRPGEPHFIIRNGGNTRLAILSELWTETKDEQFFRIACLFRPWTERGEIVALTGHLAENELHGGLTFIERALGVERARELYEREDGTSLSQSQLARRLTADGYPLSQSSISRMQEAVNHLLPAIPSLMYGGLGRSQVERLTALRNAGQRVWAQHSNGKHPGTDFAVLFHDTLTGFDGEVAGFSLARVQDELIGEMSLLLQVNYDTLLLELEHTETRHRLLTSEPTPDKPVQALAIPTTSATPQNPAPTTSSVPASAPSPSNSMSSTPETALAQRGSDVTVNTAVPNEQSRTEPTSDTCKTDRVQTTQQLVTNENTDQKTTETACSPLTTSPPVDGLFPVPDAWSIDPALDTLDALRIHIAQLAREIATEGGAVGSVEEIEDGFGYRCFSEAQPNTAQGSTVVALLSLFSNIEQPDPLAALLQGPASKDVAPLSDIGLLKVFRLIRLSRRLLKWRSLPPSETTETH
jgi:ParB family protein of integrating conjugative element (PFGI_1 class)